MSGDFAVLIRRIERELLDLSLVVSRAERALEGARALPEYQDEFLDSAALNLHDFYTGLERVFRQIAVKVDESHPEGKEWHRQLLEQMTLEIPGRRPAVLDASDLTRIQEYLGFRHVVRHVYAFQLKADRLDHLVRDLRPLYETLAERLKALSGFLTAVDP